MSAMFFNVFFSYVTNLFEINGLSYFQKQFSHTVRTKEVSSHLPLHSEKRMRNDKKPEGVRMVEGCATWEMHPGYLLTSLPAYLLPGGLFALLFVHL